LAVDNGVGIETSLEGNAGRGLVNLRKRAEKLHGVSVVEQHASGGTVVTWSVPI